VQTRKNLQAYWKENLSYISILLLIWFGVSYLCGIMIADPRFWFANQGSEIIFVVLIVIYVQLMNRLDRKYDVHED